MIRFARFSTLVVLFALLLSACGGGTDTESAIATGIAQTQQISQLETAAVGGGAAQDSADSTDLPAVEGEDTPKASETASPSATLTITLTPTLDIPLVSVSQDTNCRSGPAASYVYKTTVIVGDVLEVVGVHAQSNDYVIVDYGGGATCWLWLQYADKTDFSAYDLPTFDTPPTPTPSFDWSGTWQIWVGGASPASVTFNVSGNTVTYQVGGGAIVINYIGTISANGQILTGTWISSTGPSGPFAFQIKAGNLNQFVGNYNDGDFSYCGAKNSASQPSPCLWP